jgi:hypothetical protein
MGRPPLPDEQRRDWRLFTNLTEREYTAVERAAREDGVSASDWVRGLIQRALKRRGKKR